MRSFILGLCVAVALLASAADAGVVVITSSGNFVIPVGVTSIDVTANLQAGNDDGFGEDDDTGLNIELTEEMVADDKTVEMPASDKDSKAG